ncbi:MAG TPA: hypothetical protein VKG25_26405, partial [Bryobacteraceae bacterium]|nr:hypothetical protein [Bryobacteraceae bacterium]
MNKANINTRLSVAGMAALAALALGCPDTADAQSNTFVTSPANLTFCGATAANIPTQILTVSTSNSQAGAAFSITSNVNWIDVSPASQQTNFAVQVSIDPTQGAKLPGGLSIGQLTVSGAGYNQATVIVQLTLGSSTCTSTGASLTASTTLITSTIAPNSQDVQYVSVTNNTGAPITVTSAASKPWLSVSPSQLTIGADTAQLFTVNIFPQGILTPGQSYSATVTFTPQATGIAALTIPVTLNYGTGSGGASTLLPNPPNVAFPLAIGVTQGSTTLTVTNNGSTTVLLKALISAPWLTVTPVTDQLVNIGAAATFTLNFNASGLSATNYNTQIQIIDDSNNVGVLNVLVTLCVGATTCQGSGTTGAVFNSSPASLTFTVPPGASAPQSATLLVTSNFGSVVASAASATPNWLSVNPPNATVNGTTASTFTVTVTPGNLPAGNQATSTITFSPLSTGGISLTVPVTVNVTAVPTITSTPSSFSFAYQTGANVPAGQVLLLSSDTPGQFMVTGTTDSGGGWLVVSPQSGATAGASGAPTPISVQANPISLMPGTYTGKVVVTNTATGIAQNTPVTLQVSLLPILSFSNSETDFSYQSQSATLPIQQSVGVTSSGNPVNFLVQITPSSGGNWLVVSPTNATTPQNLSLSLSPQVLAGLAPGKYQSTIDLTAQGAGNTPVYTVVLTVTNSTLLNASQGALVFNRELFETPPVAQTFMVTSSGSPLPVTIATQTASNACGNFATATPASGTTMLVVTVSVAPNALGAAGICNGNISITSAGAANSPLNVPVTMYVSNSALLNASPSAINVSTQKGSNPPSQTVALTSTDSTTQVTFSVTSVTNQGSGWLLVGPTGGTTPMNLTIGYKTDGLSAG